MRALFIQRAFSSHSRSTYRRKSWYPDWYSSEFWTLWSQPSGASVELRYDYANVKLVAMKHFAKGQEVMKSPFPPNVEGPLHNPIGHSEKPSVQNVDGKLISCREIFPGDKITLDYSTETVRRSKIDNTS